MTSAFRSVGIISLGLIGLASTLAIWMAGSHSYGALSTVWQSLGFKGLLAISLAAYACSAAVLWDLRRRNGFGFQALLAFWMLTALPFAFFIWVLTVRFFHGGD